MRICDLHTGSTRLTRAAARLREQWQAARDGWRDQNAVDFENDHLAPLAPELTLTLTAIQRLAEVLEQAERDCLDEEKETRGVL